MNGFSSQCETSIACKSGQIMESGGKTQTLLSDAGTRIAERYNLSLPAQAGSHHDLLVLHDLSYAEACCQAVAESDRKSREEREQIKCLMRELRKTAVYQAYAERSIGLGTPPATRRLKALRGSIFCVFQYLYAKDELQFMFDSIHGQMSGVALNEVKEMVDRFRSKIVVSPEYLFQFWNTDGSH